MWNLTQRIESQMFYSSGAPVDIQKNLTQRIERASKT